MNKAKFARFLDEKLGIQGERRLPGRSSDRETQELLMLAAALAEWQPKTSPAARDDLRERWANGMSRVPGQKPQPADLPRWVRVGVPVLLLLAALIFLFRQPLQTAFANILGYGYSENAGFFKLDTTYLLSAPVVQQHGADSLTVLDGVSDQNGTQLWVKASDPALDYSGAWLETAEGIKLPVKNWQVLNDSHHAGQALMIFAPLSNEQRTVTLIFPAGWHLPLQFLSGSEWQQRAESTAAQVTIPYTTPTVTMAPLTLNPCVEPSGFEVCVRDAAYSSEGLQVLVEGSAGTSPFAPIDLSTFMSMVTANPGDGNDETVLETGNQRISNPIGAQPPQLMQEGDAIRQTLTFVLDPSTHGTAKLTLPAIAARLELAQPVMITVDLGPHPTAGQSVALPADIRIAGHTVHFDSAEITGDGVNSLRLTLTSAPLDVQDGWMVGLLELGKPEGISDRYGAGSIDADHRLKVFTELFGDDGQIKTGTLNLPVVDAMVVFPGPFEFTFTLPEANSNPVQLMPTVVSGVTFNPQPTPTPLSLQSYAYGGVALQADELLFTVVHEATTDLYALLPQSGAIPQRVATLPGQVYQVYVQPDLQGIDYLAGSLVTEKDMTPYFKNAQLFSLRFDEAGPRLLAVFPTSPSALKGGGSQVSSTSWSADGGMFAFILAGLQDSKGQYEQKAGWINLDCRESGNCVLQYVNLPATVEDFYSQQFSPVGRRLIYEAAVSSPSHGDVEKLYQVTFDATGQPGEITPVTQLDSAIEVNPRWLPDGNSLLLSCTDLDSNDVNNNHLCQWNLSTDQRTDLLDLNQYVSNPIMRNFELSPQGDLLTEGSRVGIQIFNRETRKLNLLPFSENLSGLVFDTQEQNLYLLGEKGTSIEAVDLSNMTERTVYAQSSEGYVAWIGVVAER